MTFILMVIIGFLIGWFVLAPLTTALIERLKR